MFSELKFKVLQIEEKLENASMNFDPALVEKLLKKAPSHLLETISKKRANIVFEHAKNHVPAYQKFLKKNKFKVTTSWEKIPVMDKHNYIQKYPLRSRCAGGILPKDGMIYESSGSTGKPTIWIQNKTEEDVLLSQVIFDFHYMFQSKPTIVLSTWVMGPWITGAKFGELTSYASLAKNIGEDMENILDTLEEFGPEEHYLIAGYPPFIRQLITYLREHINLDKYKIDLAIGGEGISIKSLRYLEQLMPKGSLIVSGYGASDLDIGVGFESTFCTYIRKLAASNPEFCNELFNQESVPMIFQYNPLLCHIEEGPPEKNSPPELLFTLLNADIAHPKIRYNLKDRGRKFSYANVISILRKHDPKFKENFANYKHFREILPLPFFSVFGRSGNIITFGAANIYPNQIELCLFQDKDAEKKINHFKLSRTSNKKMQDVLEVHIELKKGSKCRSNFERVCRKNILKYLGKFNADYLEISKGDPELKNIKVKVYPYNHQLFESDKKKIKRTYLVN